MYRERSFLIVFLLSISQVQSRTVNNEIKEYRSPSYCGENETFNSTTFSCVACNSTENLVPSKDRLYCVCDEQSKMINYVNGIPICEKCANNTVPTINSENCIACRNDGSSDQCTCSLNEIRIEKDANGGLLDALKCIPCPENTHNFSSIQEKNRNIGNCFPTYLNESQSFIVHFENQSIDSYYFRMNLQLTLFSCESGNHVECEHLSNMCTLTLFANEMACKLFEKNENSRRLFYRKKDTLRTLYNNDISQKYSLKNNDSNSRLNMSIVKYKLNGEFQSIDKPDLFCSFLNDVRFGINVKKNCSITAKELRWRKTEFLSPYLVYNESNKLLLHALPILLKNANTSENAAQWQLVRKFFTVDQTSGFGTAMDNETFSKEPDLSILRYLKSLEVIIKVQDEKSRSKICPPLLVVQYGELTAREIAENKQVFVVYKVIFATRDNNVDEVIKISTEVLFGFAVLCSLLKTWSHHKRNLGFKFRPAVIFWFLIYSSGAVGNILTLITIVTSAYIFLCYKEQTVFHVQLPSKSTEKNIKLYISIALVLKIVEMMSFVYKHRNVNVFFVDWEQPRTVHTRSVTNNLPAPSRKFIGKKRKASTASMSKKRKKLSPLIEESLSIVYKPRESNVVYEAQELPVSIWRTYFVANEWFELQTVRKVSSLLQIIAMLLIFEIIGLKNYALAAPELSLETDEDVERNFTLFYALGTSVYVILYSLQWLVSVTLYEKLTTNKMQHFVDLCSIANISVFILAFEYFGFYIHGRSVHGFADTDLATLTNDLQKEENNMCAHRGLVPGTTDQTFTMSLSSSFRYVYNKLLNSHGLTDAFWKKDIFGFLSWQQTLQFHSKVKRFLTGFLDHCFQDLDYIVKERLFLEKLLDTEFVDSTDKTVFYIDKSNSFDTMIFYGNEWTLGTFEVTLFAFAQTFSQNYIVACLASLIVSQLLVTICKCNGKKNLARKTLLDDRFLI